VQTTAGARLVRGLGRWDRYSLGAYAASALAIGLIVLCFAEVATRFGTTGGP
jgi:hypothetical protein